MANALQEKRKRCIEWHMKPPLALNTRFVSETFLLQNKNCNLEFYTGTGHVIKYGSSEKPFLSFKCSGNLQLTINATLRIIQDSYEYSLSIISITNANQIIWCETSIYQLTNHYMIFELTFHKDDICLQTASYITNSVRSLAEDFSKLLETGLDHDIEMKCGENTIKTHKLVLKTRSDVFRAMLQSDMLEARTGVIEIQEMDVSYFREFTKYLYTDEMHDLTLQKAKALYEAGDKYDIRSLVLRCAEYLEDILCPENAFEIYTLADAHSDEKLKDSVKNYILEAGVYRHEEHWMAFYKNFPDVALEIYRLSYKKEL